MKKKVWNIFMALGWILLIIYLGSAYFMNRYADSEGKFSFSPITWEKQVAVLDGALACSLLPEDLQNRLDYLKEDIFPKVIQKKELENGIIYFFEDKDNMDEKIMEFIAGEKQCCPFFQFDLSIQPFKEGLALKISGGDGVKDFMASFGF